MTWTPENIAALRRLWAEGKTASQIAKELGGLSRNAVIGKAHRLNLNKRPSPLPTGPAKFKKHHMTIKAEKRKADRIDTNETTYGQPKKFEDLKPNECRWPIGDVPDIVFCSATISKGVYCSQHNAIAYQGVNHDEKGIVGTDQRANSETGGR